VEDVVVDDLVGLSDLMELIELVLKMLVRVVMGVR
jgi:hypothetical protein